MKSALEQVSYYYENAKRVAFNEPKDSPTRPVLYERMYVWGEALAILQSQRGNLVG